MSVLPESSRAQRPTTAVQSHHGAAADRWLLCRTDARHIALPVAQVVETMRMLPVEHLAGAPPIVRGLAVIRGLLTPVIDPAMLFDDAAGGRERLVIVRTESRTVAFAVEAVIGVRTIANAEELPPMLHDVHAIAAVKRLDDALVFLLQAARVVADDILERCLAERTAS
jgi:purine-binding chemotaxis protein CheW